MNLIKDYTKCVLLLYDLIKNYVKL